MQEHCHTRPPAATTGPPTLRRHGAPRRPTPSRPCARTGPENRRPTAPIAASQPGRESTPFGGADSGPRQSAGARRAGARRGPAERGPARGPSPSPPSSASVAVTRWPILVLGGLARPVGAGLQHRRRRDVHIGDRRRSSVLIALDGHAKRAPIQGSIPDAKIPGAKAVGNIPPVCLARILAICGRDTPTLNAAVGVTGSALRTTAQVVSCTSAVFAGAVNDIVPTAKVPGAVRAVQADDVGYPVPVAVSHTCTLPRPARLHRRDGGARAGDAPPGHAARRRRSARREAPGSAGCPSGADR